MIRQMINKVTQRKDLTLEEAKGIMIHMMEGRLTEAQIASLVTALSMKGETKDEIAGFTMAMREKSARVPSSFHLADCCGTGGDRSNTFNISTCAAFIAAGAGVPIAKHGNKAQSSRTGSADVMEALGIKFLTSPSSLSKSIQEVGIAFIFAPLYHKTLKYASKPRRDIGINTIFNMVGPLANPAEPKVQLLGVYRAEICQTISEVLRSLGVTRAMVVHGEDGLDEITLCGKTRVSELRYSYIEHYYIQPEDFNMERTSPHLLLGGDAQENAKIILDILKGKKGPQRDVSILNAGAVIYLSSMAEDLKEAMKIAEDSLDSGKALRKLLSLKEFTNDEGGGYDP